MVGFVTQANLSDAQNFVARVLALPEDGAGFISFHSTYKLKTHKPGDKLPMGFGTVAADPADFVDKLGKELRKKTTCDFYVCMGTQRDHREKPYSYVDKKTGATISGIRYVADKSRPNIIKLKSLYTDVDFKGGDHGYPSEADAETGIAAFLAASGLPQPNVVVHTGGGFHIYWVMDRALPVEEWQVLADQLKDAINTHGLRCDNGVTADASHVLRVPNTKNYKYDPQRPVKLHKWIDGDYAPDVLGAVLGKYGNLTPRVSLWNDPDLAAFKGVKPFEGFKSTAHMKQLHDELGGGITHYDPIDITRVQCGFVRDSLATGGTNMEGQTLWNYTTLLATCTTQGLAAAHQMSGQNQYYNFDNQEELYARKEHEHNNGVGPPSCAAIQAAGCTNCPTCPHLTLGQNPLTYLSSAPAPVAPPMPTQWLSKTGVDVLPFGWQRDERGLIFKQSVDAADGELFGAYPSGSSIFSDGYVSDIFPATLHFKAQTILRTAPRPIVFPMRYLHSKADMASTLADYNIHFDRDVMQEFLMAWVEELKKNRATFTQHHAFGWAEEGGKLLGFAYDGKLYTPDPEPLLAKGAEPEIAKQYSLRGDINQWKRVAKMLTDTKRPAIDAILAAAFAAPLVYFTGEEGLFLGIHSEDSGVGKTTAMRTAQAVWANPSALQRLTDTPNSVQHKMGILRHLPIGWDELKGEENLKAIAKMIFELNSGREKNRLKPDMEQRASSEWKTLLVTASNNSLSDHINDLAKGNDAGAMRLFELEVYETSVGKISLADAAQMRMAINENFGHAGMLYAQLLGSKHETIRKLVNARIRMVEQECGIIQAERLWLCLAAVLILGAELANMLDLTEIDVPALKDRLYAEIKSMRVVLVDAPLKMNDRVTVTGILNRYLRENARSLIRTTDIFNRGGRPPSQPTIQLIAPIGVTIPGIIGQYGDSTKTLRLDRTAMDDWLKRNGFSPTIFKRGLEQFLGADYKRGQSLGVSVMGIPMATIQIAVIDIQCVNNELEDMVPHIISGTSNVIPLVKP